MVDQAHHVLRHFCSHMRHPLTNQSQALHIKCHRNLWWEMQKVISTRFKHHSCISLVENLGL